MAEDNIDRKAFLSRIGAGAAFALTYSCLGGCTKMENPKPPIANNTDNSTAKIDFTIDLSLPEYAALQNIGGYAVTDHNIVVAKDETGAYIAATRRCSHETFDSVIWSSFFKEWYCTEHDATFDKSGNGTTTINNNGALGLTVYNTELISATELRIFE